MKRRLTGLMRKEFTLAVAGLLTALPAGSRWLTYLSPLRYYVEATLGIFLKGVGLDVLWPQAVALTLYGFVLLGISTLRFRRSLA